MFVIQIASLTAALSQDWHGVSRRIIGAACVHTLNMWTLLKPTNNLRSPKTDKITTLLNVSCKGHRDKVILQINQIKQIVLLLTKKCLKPYQAH